MGTGQKLADYMKAPGFDSLTTDELTLFNFLVLIVDIKYRNKYGKVLEDQHGTGYSKNIKDYNVLADQVSPVDDGLLGQ